MVEDAHRLPARVDDGGKLFPELGGVNCLLAVVVVDVEHAALDAGVPVRFQFEDGRPDALGVQDARRRQAAEAAADDGDRVVRGHDDAPLMRDLEFGVRWRSVTGWRLPRSRPR